MPPLKSAKKWQCNIRLFTGYGVSGSFIDGITQAALNIGFPDFYYLSNAFCKAFGVSTGKLMCLLSYWRMAGQILKKDNFSGDYFKLIDF